MRIEIEIPKEFEEHFKQDKFEDTLHRLSADAHLIAGNYEKETAIMLIKAFADSQPAYNVEKVVAELDKVSFLMEPRTEGHYADNGVFLDEAIKIVRNGGAE